MIHKKLLTKLIGIVLLALITGFIVLPTEAQKKILPSLANSKYLKDQNIHLGLDLQGGTRLEYKVDLRKVPEADQKAIIDGVTEVINFRVNKMGVSEPNIYTSKIGDEHHIIVELAGLKKEAGETDEDVIKKAKDQVGKTIQLEFKEQKTEIDPEEKDKIKKHAEEIFNKIKSAPDQFAFIGKEEEQANLGKVLYLELENGYYKDDSNQGYKTPETLFNLNVNEVLPELVEITKQDNEFVLDETTGSVANQEGYAIYKVIEKNEVDRKITEPKKLFVSHILISYQSAERAIEGITRTEEEAKKRIQEIQEKLKNDGDFAALAKEYSDDASNKDKGGVLDEPVTKKEDLDDPYVDEFTNGALTLDKEGQISDIIKTSFGYHLAKADKITPKVDETKKDTKLKFARILFSTNPDPWKETALTGQFFKHADVQFDEMFNPIVNISFNEEGAKLFEEITKRNLKKPVAIFVGGRLISAPTVQAEIKGGNAIIQGSFDVEEAQALARDLNTGAIPAPIILSGQMNIGATLGEDALQKSLSAGMWGIIILALFLIIYYRASGILAVLALAIYALLFIFFIKIALPYGLAMVISLIIFSIITAIIVKSHDSGWEKLISFMLACFILFFVSFLLSNPIVLTLAGIAGIILSIGMAVDANILIFERIKEELAEKKPIEAAIELGFSRAWSSIRDSNFSTLLTCAILLYFGSSVIKGFAFNLATGILVSMFTAIAITKTFLKTAIAAKFLQKQALFIGGKTHKKEKEIAFIPNRRKWFAFSSILIVISLLAAPILGLNLGMDFTGGTLMEIQFAKQTTPEEIKNILKETEDELNKNLAETNKISLLSKAYAQVEENKNSTDIKESTPTEDKKMETVITKIDFGTPSVTSSANNTFTIRIKDIDEATHEKILAALDTKIGVMEEKKFTTIGPVVGSTLKQKALTALGIAIVMMVLYIAFAFRKVPKRINPWRFGASAIFALVHDVIIIFGLFVILGKFFDVEMDILFITAILTIIGYSVNDTIVVFDRIRENLKHQSHNDTFEKIANKALNQTLGRSINSSLSTLFTIVALFLFGAISIKYFVLALIFGITIGTYSSIFIAGPILVEWNKLREKNK